MTATLDPRIAEADAALASRRPDDARALLEAVAESRPENLDFWRKLSSLRRASGDLVAALGAIDAALALAPFDFVSLLLRADLLDRQGDPEAGEAYGRALAQRPGEALPPALQAPVARAESAWRAHQQALEARLGQQLESAKGELDDRLVRRSERLISNISRRTRPFHSDPSHFHYPGLAELEFHEPERFAWLAEWEEATDAIEREFRTLLAAESAELVPYVQYAAGAPLAQWRELNQSDKWSTLHLIERGRTIEANARHCPETMALLARIPQPWISGCGANAMFSLLAPRTRIPPHTGVANFRLVCHLPLIVPPGCRFRVGETTREWRRGEAWVFDDTIEHEAGNDSDELRVIMILDCWHPDLTEPERAAIGAIVGECAIPGGHF